MENAMFHKKARDITEGTGVRIRRLLPNTDLSAYNPFLLVDEFFITPGQGFPRHEHHGFEAFTYIVDGALQHTDTTGMVQIIEKGGMEHMMTGKGLSHSEMPVPEYPECHGFQIWVNLPAAMKSESPVYNFLNVSQIPEIRQQASVARFIVGNGAPVPSTTPLIIQEIRIEAHAHHFSSVPEEMEGLLYCYRGEIESCNYTVGPGEYFLLPNATEIVSYAQQTSGLLLLAGVPVHEAVEMSG